MDAKENEKERIRKNKKERERESERGGGRKNGLAKNRNFSNTFNIIEFLVGYRVMLNSKNNRTCYIELIIYLI